MLIKKKLAYVCHQTPEEMKGFTPVESQWRSRQVDTNLALFEVLKEQFCITLSFVFVFVISNNIVY